MSVRTISEDTIIENICYDDLIITSGANVTLKGTLYGNVDVKDNSHFQLAGIMRGNLFVSGSATAEITGSIFADEILDSGRLTIYGLVTSTSGPYHANMRPGAYVHMILH